MRKASGKRLPHGVTMAMVLTTLIRLQGNGDRYRWVSRADLVRELNLPETTIDDRLRVLVAEERVMKVGRGRYRFKPLPGEWKFPSQQPAGAVMTMTDPHGNTIEIRWVQVQRHAGAGLGRL